MFSTISLGCSSRNSLASRVHVVLLSEDAGAQVIDDHDCTFPSTDPKKRSALAY